MAAERRRWLPWVLVGGGVLAFLAYWQRKNLATVGSMVIDASKKGLFSAVLPPDAQPYSDVILQVAGEQSVDPFILVALGDRESHWGQLLSPPGPGGTADGGHGHGLMQIDDRTWGDWLAANDWTDPYTNVTKGAQILKDAMAYLSAPSQGTVTVGSRVATALQQAGFTNIVAGTYADPRPLSGDDLTLAALAAYNAGAGTVLQAFAAGGRAAVDAVTTGGDYSSAVDSTVATLTNAFINAGGGVRV